MSVHVVTKNTKQSKKGERMFPKSSRTTPGVLDVFAVKKNKTPVNSKPALTLSIQNANTSNQKLNDDRLLSNRNYQDSQYTDYGLNTRNSSLDNRIITTNGSHFLSPDYKTSLKESRYILSKNSETSLDHINNGASLRFKPFLPPRQRVLYISVRQTPTALNSKREKKKVQAFEKSQPTDFEERDLPMNPESTTRSYKFNNSSPYSRMKHAASSSPQHRERDSSGSISPNAKGSLASTRLTTDRNRSTYTPKPEETKSTFEIKTIRDLDNSTPLNNCIKMLEFCNTDMIDTLSKKQRSNEGSFANLNEQEGPQMKKLKEKIKLMPLYDCRLKTIAQQTHLANLEKPSPTLDKKRIKNDPYLISPIKLNNWQINDESLIYSLPPVQITTRRIDKSKILG